MTRTALLLAYALVLVSACRATARPAPVPSATASGTAPPPTAPLAPTAPDDAAAPLASAPPAAASAEAPRDEPYVPPPFVSPASLPCAPMTDCRVVARHEVHAEFARRRGFFVGPDGLVHSRHYELPTARPADTFFVEVSRSCETPGNYYVESGAQVWLPMGYGARPDWSPMDVPSPRLFRPLGGGFYDDGAQVYDRDESLADQDPAPDRASFRVCVLPRSYTERQRRFYPDAVDHHSAFGRGEHGDLERVRQR